MLTIREPIKIHSMSLDTGLFESFGNRIGANYLQINSSISATDFMHLLSQPPEVFFAEGDNANYFFSDVKIENKQNQKIDIITNLVNRILLNPSLENTYQDKVYISNVLRKLGITNEQEFLTEVYKNLQQTNDINQLVKSIDARTTVLNTKNEQNTAVENIRAIRNSVEQNQYFINKEIQNIVLNHLEKNINVENEEALDENYILEETKKLTKLISQTENNTKIDKFQNQIDNSVSNVRKELTNNFKNDLVNLVQVQQPKEIKKAIEEDRKNREEIINEVINEIKENNQYKTTNTSNNLSKKQEFFEQIFSRIGILEDINIINQYNKSIYDTGRISVNEMNLSNQNRIFNEMYVNEAKGNGYIPTELTFDTTNVYENQPDLTEITEEKIDTQLTTAMLYSVIDSVYQSSINKNYERNVNWVSFGNALYKSTENTVARFEENLVAPQVEKNYINNNEESSIIEQLNQIQIENENRAMLLQQYQYELQNREEKKEAAIPRRTREQAKKDALVALNNVEAFREQVAEEQKKTSERFNKIDQASIDNIPENLKARMELINAVLRTGEGGELDEEGQIAASKVLNEIRKNYVTNINNENINNVNEITKAEMVTNELVSPEKQETITNIIEHIDDLQVVSQKETINNIQKEIEAVNMLQKEADKAEDVEISDVREAVIRKNNIKKASVVVNEEQQKRSKVNLVHKENEQIDEEEIVERILEQKNNIETTKNINTVEKSTVVENVSQEETKRIIEKEIKNIDLTEQIENTLQRKMSGIEQTIFTKLEGKLSTDRQRRGL